MIKTKHIILATSSALTLFLAGCTSTTAPVLAPAPVVVPEPVKDNTVGALSHNNYNQEIDVSQKGPTFHSGMNDGCATAKGKYIKDSSLYGSDPEYKEGWFHGRRKCQPHRA